MARLKNSERKPAKKAAKKAPAKKAAKKARKTAKRTTRKHGDIQHPRHEDYPEHIRVGYEEAGVRIEDAPLPWAKPVKKSK